MAVSVGGDENVVSLVMEGRRCGLPGAKNLRVKTRGGEQRVKNASVSLHGKSK